MESLGFSIQDLYKTLLILFRTGALFMTVPVFGHVSIPRILRVWMMLIFSFLILPFAVVSDIQPPSTTFHLAVVILSELAIGFAIGFAIIILFSAVQFAGHMIGLQMGLAVASVMDPMSAERISIIGEFYYLFSLLIFLMINGHHFVIRALVRSYELIPIGGGMFEGTLGEFIVYLTGNLFIVAVKLAAPVIITLFIVNVVFGIVARTIPQMNVFIVGFPLALGIGLIMIRFSLPFFKTVFVNAFEELEMDIIRIILLIKG
ncbi:MAG TPA: flagellar biosynthetic protein FliR [bacterium]|nr:flagellar biosynthetic protein FliR [bacterium]